MGRRSDRLAGWLDVDAAGGLIDQWTDRLNQGLQCEGDRWHVDIRIPFPSARSLTQSNPPPNREELAGKGGWQSTGYPLCFDPAVAKYI